MKKQNLFQSVVAIIMLSCMISPSVSTVFGEVYNVERKYLYGSMYNSCAPVTKTENDDLILFECGEVYPLSGWDTYSKMIVQVANSTSTRSYSPAYTVREHTGVLDIDFSEDLGIGDVIRVRVRGNNPDLDGYADFAYDAL